MSIFKKLYNVTYFIKIEFIEHCRFRYLKDNYVFFHGFYMPIVNVKKLDNILSKLIETKRIPKIILIGYKSYSELMKDRKFFEDVVGSSMKPSKRTYKNIKIKVTQDDNQLEVRCFS